MYNYFKGIVTDIETNYIVIDCNGVGYQIFVVNPYIYEVNKPYIIYVYNHIKEDEYSLYGFKTKEEKDLFLRLINVKGLGPKMALPMVESSNINGIMDAIERENILYLTKFPKVGEKVARQIILDLKGKLVKKTEIINNEDFNELISVLENLGYKQADIKKILPKISKDLTLEMQIKEALKLMLK